MEFDKDLRSVQQARTMIAEAKEAQKVFLNYSQKDVDKIVLAVTEACEAEAERLAKKAHEETGFGIWQDKKLKNILGSRMVYESMKGQKTIGIIREWKNEGIIEVAVPVGVVVALIPSTNPTSTTMFKSLISLKAGNTVVFSPHPNAKNCILETVKVIRNALKKAGAPENLIQCMDILSPEGTQTLLEHRDTGIILATGGEAMVKAAYSSGNPALGVGPGNGPAYIEKTADIPKAVRHIIESKTFDNGTICASEQSVVTERSIKEKVVSEFERQGAYFLNNEESSKVEKLIMRGNNTMNPAIVGKSAVQIGEMAGINLPEGTKVIISYQKDIGKNYPYSREKLCPILGFFTVKNWEEACETCIQILENEGAGHTMTIHTNDDEIVRKFAVRKPISRLLVNTPASLGGVGATTNLLPSLTLGCGAVGGSATSDNVGPLNLINIRRVAYGTVELKELRMEEQDTSDVIINDEIDADVGQITSVEIEKITRAVLQSILSERV